MGEQRLTALYKCTQHGQSAWESRPAINTTGLLSHTNRQLCAPLQLDLSPGCPYLCIPKIARADLQLYIPCSVSVERQIWMCFVPLGNKSLVRLLKKTKQKQKKL